MFSQKILAVGSLSLLAAACSNIDDSIVGGLMSSAVVGTVSSSSAVIPVSANSSSVDYLVSSSDFSEVSSVSGYRYEFPPCDQSNRDSMLVVSHKELFGDEWSYLSKKLVYYGCTESGWSGLNSTEYNTFGQPCTAASVGTIIKGLVDEDRRFVCKADGWKVAYAVDIAMAGTECTEPLNGEIMQGKDKQYYLCDVDHWREASVSEYNTNGIECVEGDSTFGIVDTTRKFFCMRSRVTGEVAWNVLPIVPGEKNVRRVSWSGNNGEYRLDLEYENPPKTAGYWYVTTDSLDGGKSRVEWPVVLGNEDSDDAMDPVIDHCGGVCGTYHLDRGSLDYNPYVAVGFDLADKDEAGNDVAVDVDNWGGVCITYTSDVPASLVMDFGEKGNEYLGYDLPFVTLPKLSSPTTKQFEWRQFRQAGWGKAKISGVEGARNLVSLKFIIQAPDGSSGQFNIIGVGWFGAYY